MGGVTGAPLLEELQANERTKREVKKGTRTPRKTMTDRERKLRTARFRA
jgi:hypothetical protein